MDYLMLIKWIKILCLMTVFCVRSLIFGARIVLGSTLREEFKIVKSYSYVTNSTLALYTCLFMVWGATYCHIPCLLRHTAHAEKKISKATRLAIMRISNFSNLIRELTRSPYVPFTTQDSTLFLTACFDMLWGYTRIATLLASSPEWCLRKRPLRHGLTPRALAGSRGVENGMSRKVQAARLMSYSCD